MEATLPGWPSLAELAQMVARQQVSPTELVDLSYSRIALLNPHLNAFVATCEDSAHELARQAERLILRGEARPLEGIPVAVKDNTAAMHMPVTNGSRSSSRAPLEYDAEVVARLRRAGAIVVGKTNLPEFAAVPVTESVRLGTCLNPWDVTVTCGGSSGGSAVAVAAGMVPVAQGNDGGGSLRIPASCCGVLGLKPSRGRISLGPGPDGGGLVCAGFLTLRTSDQALLLDLAGGPAPGDQFPTPAPRLPFSAMLAGDGPRLRIGWTVQPPVEATIAPVCAAAVEAAAAMLADLGHEVVAIDPGWTRDWLAAEFRQVWTAGILATVLGLPPGHSGPDFLEGHILVMAELAAQRSSGELLQSQARLQLHAREVAPLWQKWDVIMTPTLAAPGLSVGELFRGAAEDPLSPLDRADRFSPYTPLFNVTGQPAASIPVHWADGFPIGVQLAAGPYREDHLLLLSRQLEQLTAWSRRRPPAPDWLRGPPPAALPPLA
jgi:amidase